MKYCVVIIFYNPDESAIKRLETYCENFDEVLVVDNSEELDYKIKNQVENTGKCIYYKMNGNCGMAEALNYAFRIAIDKRYDFILTMDQDSIYNSENINEMKKYIEKNFSENVGIYSPNYSKLYYDESKNKFIAEKPVIQKHEVKEVNFCMTSGSFVNVKALELVIPLENYFIGYVDNYLCAKLIEKNYKLLRVGRSYFSQQVGGAIKNTFFNKLFRVLNHNEIRYYYMIRNNLFLQNRFSANYKINIRVKIDLIRIIFNIFIGEKNKINKFKACFNGYKDFKNNIMGKKKE